MKLIEMSDYNRGARAYWWATFLIGALALGSAIVGVARLDRVGLLGTGVLMGVVYLTGLRPIRLPVDSPSVYCRLIRDALGPGDGQQEARGGRSCIQAAERTKTCRAKTR